MLKICTFLNRYYTEIKVFAFLLILLAINDNLASPVRHNADEVQNIVEMFVRGWFFFAGIFGVLGNGRTRKIRTFIVGSPYIYLGVFYLLKYLETHTQALIIPATMTIGVGLWLLSLGVVDGIKQRICSRAGDVIHNFINELDN